MPYVPYNTAQQHKDRLGNGITPQIAVQIDLLGALTPLTPYVPYNTAEGWKTLEGNAAPQPLQIEIDTLGAA